MEQPTALAHKAIASVFFFSNSYSYFGYGYFGLGKQKSGMQPFRLSVRGQ